MMANWIKNEEAAKHGTESWQLDSKLVDAEMVEREGKYYLYSLNAGFDFHELGEFNSLFFAGRAAQKLLMETLESMAYSIYH